MLGYMQLDLQKTSMCAQKLKSILLLIIIATLMHCNKTAIDKQVCFYRWPFVDPVKSRSTKMDPVKPLRGINRVAWVPILFHCMSAELVVWSGLFWPSVWPTVRTT